MPALEDPRFQRTVTLICQNDENGSLGVTINKKQSNLSFADVVEHLELVNTIKTAIPALPVFHGGPVQPELGMVLHDNSAPWDSTLKISENLALTTSMDIVRSLAEGNGPTNALFLLGYAGWAAGQLETELLENSWLNVGADPKIIFHTEIEHRWQSAASLIGVDLNKISSLTGHA
jgi:putative transcriptional regulator